MAALLLANVGAEENISYVTEMASAADRTLRSERRRLPVDAATTDSTVTPAVLNPKPTDAAIALLIIPAFVPALRRYSWRDSPEKTYSRQYFLETQSNKFAYRAYS